MKKCQLCNKPAEILTPRLATGPQGFRQYSVCKSCEVKYLVKFELARGSKATPESVSIWAGRLKVNIDVVKKEIKRQREEIKANVK